MTPTLFRKSAHCAALLSCLWTAAATGAAEVVDSIGLSTEPENGAADVAYHAGLDSWLIVWRETFAVFGGGAITRVVAKAYRPGGEVSKRITVETLTGHNVEPRVAAAGDGWIVVWVASSGNVTCRKVSGSGRLEGSEDLELERGAHPDVAYGSDAGASRYLVVWQAAHEDGERIVGHYLTDLPSAPSSLERHGSLLRLDTQERPVETDALRPRLADHTLSVSNTDGFLRSMHQFVYEVQGAGSTIMSGRLLGAEVFHLPIASKRHGLSRPVMAFNQSTLRALVLFQVAQEGHVDVFGQYVNSTSLERSGPAFPVVERALEPAVAPHSKSKFLVATSGSEGVSLHDVIGLRATSLLDPVPSAEQPAIAGRDSNFILAFRSVGESGEETEAFLVADAEAAPANGPPLVDAGPDRTVRSGETFVLSGLGKDPDEDPLAFQWCTVSAEGDTECPFEPVFQESSLSRVAPVTDVPVTLRFRVCVDDLRVHGFVPPCDLIEVRVLPRSAETFRRGDANDSGSVDLTDAVFTLDALFNGGAQPLCPDAADADDNDVIELSDAIFTLNFLFLGGEELPAPGPHQCAADASDDKLAACESKICFSAPEPKPGDKPEDPSEPQKPTEPKDPSEPGPIIIDPGPIDPGPIPPGPIDR